MFSTLSAFLVANGSNIAMLRFALLNDGKWSSDYELKGFTPKVEIPLIVPVDIHALLYGTREAQKSVQREYGKTSTKLSTLTLIIKLLTKLVPDKMSEQDLMKKIYYWI